MGSRSSHIELQWMVPYFLVPLTVLSDPVVPMTKILCLFCVRSLLCEPSTVNPLCSRVSKSPEAGRWLGPWRTFLWRERNLKTSPPADLEVKGQEDGLSTS